MKPSKLFFILLTIVPMSIFAQKQNKGIHFIHGQHWKSILAQAKKEHKFIFVDCYTTWCGPCRNMSTNIFTQDKVGTFFNKSFISFKAQIDSTAEDNAEIKMLYADFASINNKYQISVYPTYLFFNPNGELVHKFVGSMPADDFMKKAQNALSPSTQYYSMVKQFNQHTKDSSFLKKLMLSASEANENASAYFEAYVKTQPTMFTKENVSYLDMFTEDVNSAAFKIILNNQKEYDKIQGSGKANDLIVRVLVNSYYQSLFPKSTVTDADKNVSEKINASYPQQAEEAIALARVLFLKSSQQWKYFAPAIRDYMEKYGDKINGHDQLNDYAWTVFENCDDVKLLNVALKWSKRSLMGEDENEPMYIDTYANILYRLGNKEEAIKWEKKALSLAGEDKASYEATISKMEKNEKTWK